MAELGRWFEDRYVTSRPVEEVAEDAAPTEEVLPEEDRGHNSS